MKEIWANKRYRSMIILGLWIIFIVFIFILSSFSRSTTQSDTENNNKVNKEVNIKEVINLYLSPFNVVSYEMVITENEDKTLIEGDHLNKKYSGYLTNSNEVINYRCENQVCYKTFVGYEEQIDTYLFEGVKDPLYVTNLADKLVLKENTDDKKAFLYTETNLDETKEYLVILEKNADENEYQITEIKIKSSNLLIETKLTLHKAKLQVNDN